MTRNFPESDWRLFRQLHSIALERYCQKVLDEIAQLAVDSQTTAHQRYLKIYKAIQDRDRIIEEAFNDLRRSTALMRLITIHSYGLITNDEVSRFTQDTRDVISRHSMCRV